MRKCDCYFDKLEHEGKVFSKQNFKLRASKCKTKFILRKQDALLEIKEEVRGRNNSERK